jgi:geranylgeranyl reductase family protein
MESPSADIAVIGAGPAGAHLASLASSAGYRVLLFEPKGAWEKPCGGGVTSRGLKEYGFLVESEAYPYKKIDRLIVVSSAGKRVTVDLKYPFAVYSRTVLNDLIVQRAIKAGAELIREKIVGFERTSGGWALNGGNGGAWKSRFLVGADGAASSTRRHLIGMLPARDTAIAMGYNAFSSPQDSAVPRAGTNGGKSEDRFGSSAVVVEFLKSFSGYLWAFPRVGGINFGIASKLRERTSQSLRAKLDEFVSDYLGASGLSVERSDFFAAKIPILDRNSWKGLKVSGDGWALIGDAAGFVDPITGEGIYYALKSADLLFNALINIGSGPHASGVVAGRPAGEKVLARDCGISDTTDMDWQGFSAVYERLWREEFGQELERASQMLSRFYNGRFLGQDFNDAMVVLARYHPGIRDTMTRAIVGEQSYLSLKRDLVRSFFRPF